uniref:Uncharacterized protein n=1 Tax=Arundo donax TaxID=35708 RepID=A0A0A9AM09_ARUDO
MKESKIGPAVPSCQRSGRPAIPHPICLRKALVVN